MPIVREHDSIQHRLHGSTFHSFAAPASGSTELCAWRFDVAGGTAGIEHRVSREEVFLLLTGELVVTLDGVTANLEQLTSKLNQGQGTAGKLMTDTQLHDNINRTLLEMQQLLADIRKDPKKFLNVRMSIF